VITIMPFKSFYLCVENLRSGTVGYSKCSISCKFAENVRGRRESPRGRGDCHLNLQTCRPIYVVSLIYKLLSLIFTHTGYVAAGVG